MAPAAASDQAPSNPPDPRTLNGLPAEIREKILKIVLAEINLKFVVTPMANPSTHPKLLCPGELYCKANHGNPLAILLVNRRINLEALRMIFRITVDVSGCGLLQTQDNPWEMRWLDNLPAEISARLTSITTDERFPLKSDTDCYYVKSRTLKCLTFRLMYPMLKTVEIHCSPPRDIPAPAASVLRDLIDQRSREYHLPYEYVCQILESWLGWAGSIEPFIKSTDRPVTLQVPVRLICDVPSSSGRRKMLHEVEVLGV